MSHCLLLESHLSLARWGKRLALAWEALPLKALWALLDVLAIVVLVSGLVLWAKRRDRPFEEWLRVLTARSAEATA